MARPSTGFSAGERHGAAAPWCAALARIIVGRAAQSLLDDGGVTTDASLVVLPVWHWTDQLAVGRKGRAAGGGRLLLPARIDWDSPVLVVPAGRRQVLPWSSTGPEFTDDGVLEVHSSPQLPCAAAADLSDLDVPPTQVVAGVLSAAQATRELQRLASDGELARWEALAVLEPFIDNAVSSAHHELSMEIADGNWLLGFEEKKNLVGVILYGEHGDRNASEAFRMIERGIQPHAYARCEPTRVLKMDIARAARTKLRHRLGDPKDGTRIRAVARELGLGRRIDDEAVELVVAEFRRRHPTTRMGAKRVRDALTVDRSVLARTHSLDASGRDVL